MVYTALSDDSNTVSQFTHRKAITVTTNGTSTPVNFQCKLTITYEPGMQADFDDIRFNTKSRSYIDYWIESYVASTSAVVWVELPDAITHPGSDIIYMYYGNPGLSDGGVSTDVFPAQFNGDSTGWTEVDPNNHIIFNNNRLEFVGLNRGESAYVYKAITPMQYDWIAEWKLVITYQDSTAHTFSMGISENIDDLYSHSGDSIGFDYYKTTNNLIYIWEVDDGAATSTNDDLGGTYTTIYMRGTRVGDTAYYYAYSDSARTSLLGSTSIDVTDVTAANMDYYYLLSSLHATGSAYMNGYIDDHICRKYIANEPTPSYGTAQHQRRIPKFIG